MTPEKQSLIGFNPTVQIGDGPLIPIIGARVEMYEAGTGAVRSTDLKLERWDLLSGAAFRQLVPEMENICPGGETVLELVNEATDCMFRFLGNCTQTGGDRISHLTRGWAWLAAAMEVEAGVEYLKVPRYPLILASRTAKACQEGCVKYGEENWHNGFRLKILCNHALKHMVRFTNGVVEDDELGHASWGFMASLHMLLYRPDMCDLLLGPDYTITDELRTYHKSHLSRRQIVG